MIDLAMVEECAPDVHPTTMQTLIQNESSGNPFAIGVVDMDLTNQPSSKEEAIESANNLIDQGYNISLGLAQINMHNFDGLGLTVEKAFDPCSNIQASSSILNDCYERALESYSVSQEALQAAFSCYYSNNFNTGFMPDDSNGDSYVGRIAKKSEQFRIPEIEFTSETLLNPNENDEPKEAVDDVRAIEETEPDSDKENQWDVFSDFNE